MIFLSNTVSSKAQRAIQIFLLILILVQFTFLYLDYDFLSIINAIVIVYYGLLLRKVYYGRILSISMDENNFEVYFHNQVKEVVEYRKLNVDLYSDQFIIEYDRNKGLTIKKTDWQEYEKLKSTLLEKIPASKLTKGKNSRRVFWGLLSALFD